MLKTLFFSVKHSLKFFLTGIPGTANFSEFSTVTVDEFEISHCDKTMGTEDELDCRRRLTERNPQNLHYYSRSLEYQHLFKAYMNFFKKNSNQTEGKVENVLLRIL